MNIIRARSGQIENLLRSIIFSLLLGSLAACGFYLAGGADLPPQLASMQLYADDLSNSQKAMLKQRLKQAGVNLTDNQNEEAIRLRVSIKALPERRLADTAGSGKTIIRLFRQLDYSLATAAGDPIADQKTILRQTNVEQNSDDIGALEHEKQSAAVLLDQALVNQMIFQLRHLQI
jgi:outer membrane lipopolysaccharide assembly protein LptE/RlpB